MLRVSGMERFQIIVNTGQASTPEVSAPLLHAFQGATVIVAASIPVSTHAAQNRELYLSTHGGLPGTLW